MQDKDLFLEVSFNPIFFLSVRNRPFFYHAVHEFAPV